MLLQEDGRVVISSLNSAQQTKIIHQQQAGDTLLVAYKTWVPLFRREYSAAESTVPLTAQIRYVKCANRRYRVVQAAGGFRLEQL
ncbi:hypothetical protein CLV45_3638 [Hymenobacter chitinivorans DSM 11115]|uniref:Uncharacterized protein n=2 Tax=Hymenobacter chitinivorans TaxID=89969 RepID=A0A2M9B4U6_9BACT|nr:hypothetical protein CLV45_3638 [Hymenobacter chitinivorans DSM 11115]